MDAFVKPALAAKIKGTYIPRANATRKALGTTVDLVLYRDCNEDGEEDQLPAQNVLVEFAQREPAAVRASASAYMAADGTLGKEVPFDVRPGDRFRLPATAPTPRGAAGVVSIVMPAENGWVEAPFTLQG